MKTISLLLLILTCFSCKTQHEEGVLMKPTLQPNLIYHTSVLTETNTTIEYADNADIIEALKAKGIDYPITSNSKNIMESTLRTGQKTKEGNFSFKCTYDNVVSDLTGSITKLKEPNKVLEKLRGTIAYGIVDSEMKIRIDSIVGLKDESLRSTIEQGMSNMLNQIDYPNRNIQIGESFTQKTPIKYPAKNGIVMDMVITNKYLLDSVSNSIAFFTIDQIITVETDIESTTLTVEGQGKGLIEYDIQNRSNRLFVTEIEMYSTVEMGGIKIITKAITKSTTRTEIEKPNDNNR